MPPVFNGFFHAASLVFMMIYLWSRQNPNAPVRALGACVGVCGCGWRGMPRSAARSTPARSTKPPHPTPTPPPPTPHHQVSLFGIIKLNGKHLPWAFLALDLIMGAPVWPDMQGILMGHT